MRLYTGGRSGFAINLADALAWHDVPQAIRRPRRAVRLCRPRQRRAANLASMGNRGRIGGHSIARRGRGMILETIARIREAGARPAAVAAVLEVRAAVRRGLALKKLSEKKFSVKKSLAKNFPLVYK